MKDLSSYDDGSAVIKVIGVGGGGGNAVKHMIESDIKGVEFICANTDRQALSGIGDANIIQIGQKVTKGLGAGTNPAVGRDAAMEDRDAIMAALEGTEMVFITTGMGGGTGTGATPVIASIAREMGILTIAVVTRPFPFEGKRRAKFAEEGIQALTEHVDSLITIPNEKLMSYMGKDASLLDAFAKADDVLAGAVAGISNLINMPGMINVDFADVRAVMSEMGMALMGTGTGSGPERATEAANMAIHNPLLSNVDLRGARGFLVNISSGQDISLGEFSSVGNIIEEYASENAIVKMGIVVDPSLRDELRVTVVATGLDSGSIQKPMPTHESRRTHQAPPERPLVAESEPRFAREDQRESRHESNVRPSRRHVQQNLPEHTPVARNEYEEPMNEQASDFTHEPVRQAGREMPLAAYGNQSNGRESVAVSHRPSMRSSRPNSDLSQPHSKEDMDYMDIPAFLRRNTGRRD